ncbi:MAG: DUF2807 domain-containing protein [Betaproteobacteria bacterium]|nr:DUF2807 domain-containing protein [Betaproteobacteria bacterium]
MIRRRIVLAVVSLALAAAPSAFALADWTPVVASGKVASESRPVGDFTGIALSLPGKVEVVQGSPASVTVEADDNLLPEIETVVEASRLRIRFHRNLSVMGRSTLRVKVTAPNIESLAVAGSGDISAGKIAGAALSISVGGSGDVSVADVQVEALRVAIAGSGDVKAAGRATDLAAKIAGSGDLGAGRLEAKRATVSVAGSGDATLWARESLEVSVAGSGDVRYHGDPVVKKSVAGSGTVKRLGPAP